MAQASGGSILSQKKLAELQKRYPGAEVFVFGDRPELCAHLLELVIAGKKTATCGAARDFGAGGDALPIVGRRDIAASWDSTPSVLIETVSVDHVRFCDVSAAFALAEGENECRDGWARDHQAYFERNGGFDPEMMLVCEHFKVVEVLDGA